MMLHQSSNPLFQVKKRKKAFVLLSKKATPKGLGMSRQKALKDWAYSFRTIF